MSDPTTFTDRTVADLTCPAGKKDVLVFDDEMRGFGLRVTASGAKVFLIQYTAGGERRRMKVGNFGALTVKEARKRAKALLGQVAGGGDPVADRKAEDDRRTREAAAAKARAAEDAFTFRRLVDAWAEAREGERRASYLGIAVAAMRRHFAAWLERPAISITRAEAIDALDRIKKEAGRTAANRALAYARAAFGWAVNRGQLPSNPLAGIEAPSRDEARDRVLSKDEVGAIWRGADALSPTYRDFVRVLLLTLQRRDEVAGMEWAELDDATAPTIWTLPAARAKNRKAHVVHLSEPARAILAAVPKLQGCPHVFPGEGGKPVTAFSHAKRALEAAIAAEIAKEAGSNTPAEHADEDGPPPGPPGWTFHDFRRGGVTALANMGVAPHVADKLLNHVSGTIKGVAAVYQRAEFLNERKAALDAWARFVLAASNRRELPLNVLQMVRTV